jgi:phosphoribosylaminoimidazolecarboxamide formyltransferase/IMP cyclohydrolase
MRYRLAKKAFEHTAAYDRAISDFLGTKALQDVESCYNQ